MILFHPWEQKQFVDILSQNLFPNNKFSMSCEVVKTPKNGEFSGFLLNVVWISKVTYQDIHNNIQNSFEKVHKRWLNNKKFIRLYSKKNTYRLFFFLWVDRYYRQSDRAYTVANEASVGRNLSRLGWGALGSLVPVLCLPTYMYHVVVTSEAMLELTYYLIDVYQVGGEWGEQFGVYNINTI